MSLVENLSALGESEVVLLGRPKVGKSTLINAIFGKVVCAAGGGFLPITKDFGSYKHPDVPLVFWDSAGLEYADHNKQLMKVNKFLTDRESKLKEVEQLPYVLFCISPVQDVEEFDKLLFGFLNDRIGVIVVITQGWREEANDLLEAAPTFFPGALGYCSVNSVDYVSKSGNHPKPASGLLELTAMMKSSLPLAIQRRQSRGSTLIRTTKIMKQNALFGIQELASSLAKKVGLIPIPGLDQVPVKACMKDIMLECAKCYGERFSAKFIDLFVKKNDTHEIGGGWFKAIPILGTIFAGIYSGYTAYNFALNFGRNFASAMYRVRIRTGTVQESEIEIELAGSS